VNTQVLSGSLSGERLGVEIQDLERETMNHIVAFHGFFYWGGGGGEGDNSLLCLAFKSFQMV
jgi:hypothetical protein